MDGGNRGQNGIQLLLTAEQEAQQIVNAARNGLYFLVSFHHFPWLRSLLLTTSLTSKFKSQNRALILEQTPWDVIFDLFSAKLARLKQAKEEAEREVTEFRAQMEADYQRKLTEV